MSLDLLIKQITPFYNNYRENKFSLSGTESLEIMWEVGELLLNFINETKITPNALFRNIYGNSEGTKNVIKKSYITREFQTRCLRVRKLFIRKENIRIEFPMLKKFRLFSKAMPFLDNPKFKLNENERKELISILNSKKKYEEIYNYIYDLQKRKIGIKNPRTQRLHELEFEKQAFIEFYNSVFKIIKEKNYELVKLKLNGIDIDFLKMLSRNVSALSQEGLKVYEFEVPHELEDGWKNFCEVIKYFISQKNPKERRRFRRLIPPERIVRLADMLYALVSKQTLENFK